MEDFKLQKRRNKMIKEITKKWLLKNNACQSGINDWEKETNHETIATIKRNIERNPKQANWIITKVMSKEQNKKYALFAALQVSPLWAKKYPEKAKIWKRWIKAARLAALNCSCILFLLQ